MNQQQRRLLLAVAATAIFLLVLIGTIAASMPLWFRYGGVAGLNLARDVAYGAGGLAIAALLVALGIVAVAAALHPADRRRKFLFVLPAYFLGFTLVGAVLGALGIGTVGPFIGVWLGLGTVLSIISLIVTLLRIPLSTKSLRAALTVIGLTAIPGLVAWLAMLAIAVLVLTSRPSAVANRAPGAGQANTPAAGAQAAPGSAGDPQPGSRRGPGGGSTSRLPLFAGVGLLTLALLGQGFASRRVLRERQTLPAGDSTALPPSDYRRETGQALYSSVIITVVGLALAQLVPVSRTNPPAQTSVQWDSPQTAELAKRACMDCHSNTTTWPWYGYIAPGSWLLASHVSDGRVALNLSALNTMPAFRKQNMTDDIARDVRNGAMPPADYLILHPTARLSASEKQQLIQGLQKSLAR